MTWRLPASSPRPRSSPPSGTLLTDEQHRSRREAAATRLLYFVGGGVIFIGIVAFLAQVWDELGSVMHVVVTLGSFTGNRAPLVSVSADQFSVSTNALVSFTAMASDPDGDPLAFWWDYGDRTFSDISSPDVAKSWSTAGGI